MPAGGLVRFGLMSLLSAGLWAGGQSLAAEPAAASGPEQLRVGDPARRERSVTPVLDGIVDTRRGEVIDTVELARRLRDVRVLFIGEEHTNGEFHRVQLRTIEALHAAGRKVIIGLEMFPWGDNPPLERWRRGELDESRFLDESRWYEVWSHHWGHYRDIFFFARDKQLRLVGLNAPREVVRAVRAAGGFEALDPAVRSRLPPRIDLSSDEHRQVVRSYFDAEDTLHAKMSPADQERIYLAQVTWDASMGWQAGQALSSPADPREIVVVLIGAGHVAYDLGAARQLAGSFAGGISSLIPVTVPPSVGGSGAKTVSAAYAQFLWGVPQTAQPTLPLLGVSLMGRIGKEPMQVIQVDAASTAAAAGLKVGDVLRGLDGLKLDGGATLQRKVGDYRWGDSATLTIERDGQPLELRLHFRRQP
ncbi:MAG: PDZ domain-containing protein [Gammaproteobacteria bacterium]|nr:PDZ domain-containing protein [Gammaproteobacteria bacterium]